MASANSNDVIVARRIAREILASNSTKTPWRRVSTLRDQFEMTGVMFTRGQRQRMQDAFEKAGLHPEPEITEVDRGTTVRLPVGSSRPPSESKRASARGSGPKGPRIFVSYRRSDALPHVNWICEGLERRLPDAELFRDLDSIAYGEDFQQRIDQEIADAQLVLVVIGDNWLDREADGTRRIDRSGDFLRLEILAALERGVALLPVLIEGAAMPTDRELPEELSRLARRHAIELLDQRGREDLDRLAAEIDAVWSARDSSARPTESKLEIPARITVQWLAREVPSHDVDSLEDLLAELRRRGWTEGELIDYVQAYTDHDLQVGGTRRGGAPAARNFDIPARVTASWLQTTVPVLDADERAALAEVLRQRRWTEGEIEDWVFAPPDERS